MAAQTHKKNLVVDNSQVICLHMFRVKTMLMSSAQRTGKKTPLIPMSSDPNIMEFHWILKLIRFLMGFNKLSTL